jgi:transcription antitermination factor NusG
MYRVDDNPPQRFPVGRSLKADRGNWIVVHLKSRREKIFALELKEENIGYYLPLYEKRTMRKDNNKVRKTINPVFPGYLAMVFEKKSFKIIRDSAHVASFIDVINQGTFIRELSQIQRILEGSAAFKTHDMLVPGDRVRVRLGPFSGIEGVVVKFENRAKLIVSVEMFGQSISVDINEDNLIKL